ncbi:MAG: SBBP repeat-containing protein, partial [Bacteroidota bacterium]
MKKFKLLLLIIIASKTLIAQPVGILEWAKQAGGDSTDSGNSIALDGSGNVYTAGEFSRTVDFDPGPGTYNLSSAGSNDIFILKLDAFGNFIWAKQVGGTSDEFLKSMAIDDLGNAYITGKFYGTVDFDPGIAVFNLTPANLSDGAMFISKLNTNGDFVWAKKIDWDYTWESAATDISVDIFQNVYVTGAFENVIDFDPGSGVFNLTATSQADVFILKLDAAGDFKWAKSFYGPADADYGHTIEVDNFGNVYTTGNFIYADFDPGPGTYILIGSNGDDIFISKLDSSGNFVWAKQIGGAFYPTALSDLDANGNIYVTGEFDGTVDFDPDSSGSYLLTSSGAQDIYVFKLDSAGNFIWAKQMGGTLHDEGWAIDVSSAGDVYTTGEFRNTVDFDPGIGVFNLSGLGIRLFLVRSKLNFIYL